MTNIHPELLKQLKEYYKAGTKVRLVHMSDPYETIPSGTTGEVLCVDSLGTLHVMWSNGSTLGVVFREDSVVKIEENELE